MVRCRRPGLALKQQARHLADQRTRIEAEIESVSARLQAPGQPGIAGGLLDKEVSTPETFKSL